MSDYDQPAADNSGFYYSWGDNRDSLPQNPKSPSNQGPNIYFQRIPSISGTPSADSIIARLDPSDNSLIETLVNGTVAYRDVLASGNTITIDGMGGNDTVSILGGLSPDLVLYTGTGPSDQMTVTGGGSNTRVEVARGTVVLDAPHDLASLHIDNGAHLTVSPATGGNNTLFTPSLQIDGTGTLDLTDNKMVIDYTGPVGTLVDDVRLLLSSGRIITSATATAPARLGYADNAVLGLSTFGNHAVDASSLLVKFTYEGDANLDGQVDVTDLGALATNWQTNAPWTGGDFNYDDFVDVTDLGMLATDWQAGVGNPLNPQLPSSGGGDDAGGSGDDGGFMSIVQDLGLSDKELSDILAVLGSNAGAPPL